MMLFRKLLAFTVSILLCGSAIFIGCSDTIEIVTSPGDNITNTSQVLSWFPLNEGYSTVYKVSTSGGNSKLVSFKVGKEVAFQNGTAIEWLSNDPIYGADTGFFRYSNDAIYYYDTKNSSPEKIVQLPLTPGYSWDRSDVDTISISTNFDDQIDGGYKDSVIIVPITKNLPIVGELTMTVEAVQALELQETNNFFSSSVRVSVQNSGQTNYYWFVQGVGLVKYVLGAQAGNYTSGSTVAELVDYGFPVY